VRQFPPVTLYYHFPQLPLVLCASSFSLGLFPVPHSVYAGPQEIRISFKTISFTYPSQFWLTLRIPAPPRTLFPDRSPLIHALLQILEVHCSFLPFAPLNIDLACPFSLLIFGAWRHIVVPSSSPLPSLFTTPKSAPSFLYAVLLVLLCALYRATAPPRCSCPSSTNVDRVRHY